MAIKPLQDKICSLINVIKELHERVVLVGKKHDKIPKKFTEVTRINTQQTKDIKLLNKLAAERQKKNEDDETKLEELEQYDSRQNLQFHGVPVRDGEDVTHTILELVKK